MDPRTYPEFVFELRGDSKVIYWNRLASRFFVVVEKMRRAAIVSQK